MNQMSNATRSIRRVAIVIALMAVIASTIVSTAGSADAASNPSGDVVSVFNPIIDHDADHRDVSANWPISADTAPSQHQIVYRGYGYPSDISLDVFAKAANKRVVTPYAARTRGGDRVISRVTSIRPGCRSGNVADGGYVVTVEAINARTGRSIAIANLMHLDRPQVRVGTQLEGWATIGFTKQFRYNSCYQVSRAEGIHVHLEWVNAAAYGCWVPFRYNAPLTESTVIGYAGTNHRSQRARC